MQSSLAPAALDSSNEEWGEFEWEDWGNDGAGDSKGDSKQVAFNDDDPSTWGEFVEEFKHISSGETQADTEKSAIVLKNKNLIIHMATFLDARTFLNLILLNKLFHEVISSYEGDIHELKKFMGEHKIEIPKKKEWPTNPRKHYVALLGTFVNPDDISIERTKVWNGISKKIISKSFSILLRAIETNFTLNAFLLLKLVYNLADVKKDNAKKLLNLLTRGARVAYQNQRFEIVDPNLLKVMHILCREDKIDEPALRVLFECGILPPATSLLHLDKFYCGEDFERYFQIFKENGFSLINMATAIRELHLKGHSCATLKIHLFNMILLQPNDPYDLLFTIVASFYPEDKKIDFKIFNKLLELGANILAVDEKGNTFLQRCILNDILVKNTRAGYDKFHTIECILQAIIDFRGNGPNDLVFLNFINHKNNEGMTLLMMAAEKNHSQLIGLFLEKGANCLAKNVRGETALDIARCADEIHVGMIVNLTLARNKSNNIRLVPVSQFSSLRTESKHGDPKDDTQQAIIKILIKRYFNAMPHPKFLPQRQMTSFFNANKQFVSLKSELFDYLQILQTTKMNNTQISETLDQMQQDAYKRSGLGTKEFDSLVKMLDDIRAMFGMPVIIPKRSYRF